jgi:hypothetical protein
MLQDWIVALNFPILLQFGRGTAQATKMNKMGNHQSKIPFSSNTLQVDP